MNDDLTALAIGNQKAIHAAVRRDLDRMVGWLDAGLDDTAVASFRTYWDAFAAQLHHHHVTEDAEVWPVVRAQLGEPVTALLDDLDREHGVLAAAMSAAGELVQALPAPAGAATCAEAGAAVAHLRDVVGTHLTHEESDALHLITQAFDDAMFLAFLGRLQADLNPATFLPWLLDGAPTETVARLTASLPPPARDQLTTTWQPAREELVAALGST